MKTKAEVVRASELGEKVVQRIFELRDPEAMPSYRKELRRYKRALGKKPEVVDKVSAGGWLEGLFATTARGFHRVTRDGRHEFVTRPRKPTPAVFQHYHYSRSGFTTRAFDVGLLADPRHNREIRPERVERYAEAMAADEWRDLLSDPIAVTAEGHLINGQHRLAAASQIDWSTASYDPAFLVIWDVEPEEALLADGSRRTPRDENVVARKILDLDPSEASTGQSEEIAARDQSKRPRA